MPTICQQLKPDPESLGAVDNRFPANYDHDDCIIKVATSTNNASICENDKFYISDYNWNCYSQIAYQQKNKDICLKISDLTWQQDCIKTVTE